MPTYHYPQDGTPEHAVEEAIVNHRRWMGGAVIYERPDGTWEAVPGAHQTDAAFRLGGRRILYHMQDLADIAGPEHDIDPENPEPWAIEWIVRQILTGAPEAQADDVPFADPPDPDDAIDDAEELSTPEAARAFLKATATMLRYYASVLSGYELAEHLGDLARNRARLTGIMVAGIAGHVDALADEVADD